jgi:hypothetical protein
MADLALDVAVLGFLPALVERLHVMAGRAESGGRGDLDRDGEDDEENAENDEDGPEAAPPLFSLRIRKDRLPGCAGRTIAVLQAS